MILKYYIYLFIVFLFQINQFLFAQKPASDTTGEVWYFGIRHMAPYEDYSKVKNAGDTMIEGRICTKLKETRYQYDGSVIDEGIKVICRDSDHVFYYVDSSFYVLIDYTWQPGDTVKIRAPYYAAPFDTSADTTFPCVIDSIGTIFIDGYNFRTLFWKSLPWVSLWDYGGYPSIEKIIGHYFYPQHELYDMDYFGAKYLRCYFNDSLNISYSTPGFLNYFGPCDTIYIYDYIPFLFSEDMGLKINFDPFTDKLTIEILKNSDEFYSIEIIDRLGRNMFSKKNINDNIATININNYYQGIYLVKISNAQSFLVKKIFKP